MSNMSYCMFQNTLDDLRQCRDAIDVKELRELSSDERRALIDLLKVCSDIISDEEYIKEELNYVKEEHYG